MRYILIILVVSSLFFGSSCTSYELGKGDKVDSLVVQLNMLEAKMQQVDIVKINQLISINEKLISNVNNLLKDTLLKEEMFVFSDFKRYRKSLVQIRENASFQFEQFGYTRVQLENLVEDIDNGLVVDDLFKEYYSSEKEAISRLDENADQLISWYSGTFEKFNTLKVEVEKILEEHSK